LTKDFLNAVFEHRDQAIRLMKFKNRVFTAIISKKKLFEVAGGKQKVSTRRRGEHDAKRKNTLN
jgi:hypothetical protein